MPNEMSDLAVLNSLIDREEKLITQLEERLFLEQLRLASLKAARERAIRQEIVEPDDDF